jgi:hypothetical protein
MKALAGLLFCLMLTIQCVAQEGALADLQRRADEANGVDCVHLSMDTARKSLEEANRLFGAGDVKSAHGEVDASVRYARRSVDCSLHAQKSEKNEEIDLRKLIRRMKDVSQTLDSEDRPHIAQSLVELDKERDRLLHSMFGAALGSGAQGKNQ